MTRIVITAAGVCSPIGTGLDEFGRALASGAPGVDNIENFDTASYPVRFAGEARRAGKVIRTPHGTDRKDLFLRTALDELLAAAPGLGEYPPENRLLVAGTGIDYFDLVGYAGSGAPDAVSRWEDYTSRSCRITESLAGERSITGGVTLNVSACVASTQAIGHSLRLLRATGGTAVITGGFDSMLSPLHYIGFYKLGAFSGWTGDPRTACKPFDRRRSGIVLGEGAALFLVQREEESDPSRVLMEIAGYGSSMDSYQVTDPEPEGLCLARAALEALEDAGLSPEDIDCVHLHGTGTPKNDVTEAHAMRIVFGDRFSDVPVYSMKGQIGHLIGACGAMEMLGVIHSLRNQEVLPTVNFEVPDPAVPLRVVQGAPLKMKIRNILKLNAAFGGQNTAIVARRYEP